MNASPLATVALPAPTLEHVADFRLDVAPATEVGDGPLGHRRVIPILSGTVSGPRLNGRVLPGGADFQLIRHDAGDGITTAEIEARYVLETTDGARIYIVNAGVRSAASTVIAQLNRGETVDPARIYFRTAPRFETAAPHYLWLTQHLFVATGARYPDRVELRYFLVR
ncbi:DUF3237 domain-containing protein [Cupriavidus sp. RAF12]|uniref:DUF3237 domain-containing protein n=1 Tax=Cupriavidus sp. RAF12 TaxID=3233050 RepID=UPI003F8D9497